MDHVVIPLDSIHVELLDALAEGLAAAAGVCRAQGGTPEDVTLDEFHDDELRRPSSWRRGARRTIVDREGRGAWPSVRRRVGGDRVLCDRDLRL